MSDLELHAIAAVLANSSQFVPSNRKLTTNVRALVVPVAKVAVVLKLVFHVITKLEVPLVRILKCARWPVAPPATALNVQALVGVIVRIATLITADIVPEVAGNAPEPERLNVATLTA